MIKVWNIQKVLTTQYFAHLIDFFTKRVSMYTYLMNKLYNVINLIFRYYYCYYHYDFCSLTADEGNSSEIRSSLQNEKIVNEIAKKDQGLYFLYIKNIKFINPLTQTFVAKTRN